MDKVKGSLYAFDRKLSSKHFVKRLVYVTQCYCTSLDKRQVHIEVEEVTTRHNDFYEVIVTISLCDGVKCTEKKEPQAMGQFPNEVWPKIEEAWAKFSVTCDSGSS